jgi:cytoskeleton protein RodZ
VTVGEILREARRKKGITLEQAQAATRIRLKYLQALEEDDYAVLPGPVYARGFLRNYAAYLGLIPEEIVDLYRQQHPEAARSMMGVRPHQPIRNPISRHTWSPPTSAVTFSIMIVLVLLLNWAYAHVFPSAQQRQVGEVEPKDLAGIAIPEPSPTPLPTASPAPTATPAATPKAVVLTLDLRALRDTNVRVVVDGDVRFEGTMRRGALQVWSGRSIAVRASSGDALEIKVNGQPAGTLGPNGQPAEREWRLAT